MKIQLKLTTRFLILALMLSFMPASVTIGYAADGLGPDDYDFVAHAADANVVWSSGAGALTFPGSEGNANGYAIKYDKPIFEDGKDYGAGLLFVPNNAVNGYIQAVYPPFKVQSGDRFQARIGCQSGATTCYVAYRLQYQIDGSTEVRTFWKEPPFRERYEGKTYAVNLSLNSLAGQNVKFILSVSAYDSSVIGDRALWGSPRITRTVPPPPPANCTDRAQFIKDFTIPDGTVLAPNAPFTKTWRIKNIGTCTWTTAYQLVFDKGDKLGGLDSVSFDTAASPKTVAPGQTVDVSVNLTASNTVGTYTGYWKFKNDKAVAFGVVRFGNIYQAVSQTPFWVKIKVPGTGIVP